MNFRTKVTLATLPKEWKITFADEIMLLGSCFSDSVGSQMQQVGLKALLNPFGTLYNPCSIAMALHRLTTGTIFTKTELFSHEGLYHSFMHHSQFSSTSVEDTLLRINTSFVQAQQQLKTARFLIITLGTAWIYRLADTGQIVANCHKLPERFFVRNRLSVDEVVSVFEKTIAELQAYNPNLHIVFTVSPIRHFRDGAHANQLSKSTLLLAVEELCRKYANTRYFPAYEIVLDELRDYRFFADDMVHPSPLAVQYVWECFCEEFFDEQIRAYFPKIEKVRKALLHRPLNADTQAYIQFKSNILQQKEALEHELGIKICSK